MGKETRTTLFTLVFPAPKGVLVNRLESISYLFSENVGGWAAAKPAFKITHAKKKKKKRIPLCIHHQPIHPSI